MDKQSRIQKIASFDPNAPSPDDAGIFGLPFSPEESEVVIFPVPWEVTVSYNSGTAGGPQAILEASGQVDLYDPFYPEGWQHGFSMISIPQDILDQSTNLREKASQIIDGLSNNKTDQRLTEWQKEINLAGEVLTARIKSDTGKLLDRGQSVILLGGDHSTPLGYIQALAERNPGMGILQIDAHMDLRNSFEGFTYSHASIMHNALKVPGVSKLVQAGIRDYCQEEADYITAADGKVVNFFDRHLKTLKFEGHTYRSICDKIVAELPQQVYISFDIDGLDPKLCPNTGTPVAGGFEAEEVMYLFEQVIASGREIIGADLNEVAPGENDWDANVGARILFRLCNMMALSRKGVRGE